MNKKYFTGQDSETKEETLNVQEKEAIIHISNLLLI